MSDLDRFYAKVVAAENCCHAWTGSMDRHGYGRFHKRGPVLAHRFIYETMRGAIPAGMTIDHLCRNRRCVNVDHMEVVSRGENVLRGHAASAINARKATCPNGHPYDYVTSNGWRQCKTCHAARQARYRLERKENA